MATLTTAELRNRALRYLGVLEAQEAASAEDANVIEGLYDTIYAELETMGHAYWTKTAIPEDVAQGLVVMIAADAAPTFIGDISERVAYANQRSTGIQLIARMVSKPNLGMPITRSYF